MTPHELTEAEKLFAAWEAMWGPPMTAPPVQGTLTTLEHCFAKDAGELLSLLLTKSKDGWLFSFTQETPGWIEGQAKHETPWRSTAKISVATFGRPEIAKLQLLSAILADIKCIEEAP